MSRQLRLKNFLRYINIDLLKEYFSNIEVEIQFNDFEKESERLDDLEKQIMNLDQETFILVETDFLNIKEMASEGGILSILNIAQASSPELASEIGEIENHTNQSFYCFLNQRDYFEKAKVLYYITGIYSKTERMGLKEEYDFNALSKRRSILATNLKTYLEKIEGRGKNCEIEVYQYSDRICFLCYPEDYIKSDFYYDNGELMRGAKRPIFEIVYIYYPKGGRLELVAKGGKNRIMSLIDMFNYNVLKDMNSVPENQIIYDLDKFLNPEFELTRNAEDMLEQVFLKQIKLTDRYNTKKRITIEIDGGSGTRTMLDEIKNRNINSNDYNVVQATIKFKFEAEGKKGNVSMQLTYPDKNNLKETEYHLKAKNYISKWGLIHEDAIQQAS